MPTLPLPKFQWPDIAAAQIHIAVVTGAEVVIPDVARAEVEVTLPHPS